MEPAMTKTEDKVDGLPEKVGTALGALAVAATLTLPAVTWR